MRKTFVELFCLALCLTACGDVKDETSDSGLDTSELGETAADTSSDQTSANALSEENLVVALKHEARGLSCLGFFNPLADGNAGGPFEIRTGYDFKTPSEERWDALVQAGIAQKISRKGTRARYKIIDQFVPYFQLVPHEQFGRVSEACAGNEIITDISNFTIPGPSGRQISSVEFTWAIEEDGYWDNQHRLAIEQFMKGRLPVSGRGSVTVELTNEGWRAVDRSSTQWQQNVSEERNAVPERGAPVVPLDSYKGTTP